MCLFFESISDLKGLNYIHPKNSNKTCKTFFISTFDITTNSSFTILLEIVAKVYLKLGSFFITNRSKDQSGKLFHDKSGKIYHNRGKYYKYRTGIKKRPPDFLLLNLINRCACL